MGAQDFNVVANSRTAAVKKAEQLWKENQMLRSLLQKHGISLPKKK